MVLGKDETATAWLLWKLGRVWRRWWPDLLIRTG
jgi:hypothetical protein